MCNPRLFILIGALKVPVDEEGGWIPYGQGSTGLVTRARIPSSGSSVALKAIPVHIQQQQDLMSVLQQLNTLHSSSHPCVVDFYGADYFQPGSCILIASEFMDLASFKDVMNCTGPVPERVLGFATCKILEGLEYLHKQRHIIHRDIKPSNLLLNTRGDVKIGDFGMSTQLQKTLDPANTWVGSTTYMSPERISGLQYLANADVWSLGICLVELARGTFPYTGDGGKRLEMVELLDKIVDDPPPALPETFSGELCGFVGACLCKRMEERPTSTALRAHAFVAAHQGACVDDWLKEVAPIVGATLGAVSPSRQHG
mmetsp:Transcript_53512/g.130761  ORF Transcript_53512/g.130761 Transcript_53512/m.130761 type:complete len:314 (+) Transcript_53512:167-1108(+)|eukprot:CAMPEP_0206244230 /NCGR_PEP_ID=MMETSP0047_2-20121206/18040_1 /ASSEMBLY_ACC=CAM_ASM_000192 /TAXON_ID=195065 /ORGANISM="Chroomonas mesostigmatica_cf, Strain CCMP1168" /LENGTH=313 /DNA_ID=CAMNT_0053669423 /DNA_START=167 /DNA_END=1108 /DNA_ORIENTATION=+